MGGFLPASVAPLHEARPVLSYKGNLGGRCRAGTAAGRIVGHREHRIREPALEGWVVAEMLEQLGVVPKNACAFYLLRPPRQR